MSRPTTEELARRFPADFEFGVATAAYQIEGAVEEDGRKPSIWDAFSHTPGRVLNGDTGDVACDHYHRYKDDLALAASLGADIYRFSVAWPRVIPDGEGAVNDKGLDFYDRLVDTMLANGLKPHITMHHWDLPVGLHGWGGWTARRTAHAFADFSSVVMKRLGDRLEAVTTINEPWCVTILSYLYGIHAPGEQNIEATLKSIHTVNLAHGLCVDAVRAIRPDIPVGIVMNAESIYPATAKPEDAAAARRRHLFHNGLFCGPIFGGAYPEEVVAAYRDIFPKIEPGDMEIISRPLDYFGLNYYMPARIADAPGTPYPAAESLPAASGVPTTAMDWEVSAAGLSHVIRLLKQDWTLPPIYITENGSAYHDTVAADGSVHDPDRLAYLQDHLAEVAAMIDEGMDVKGYIAWSLMDNFEWSKGYDRRFGLIHVDYETQKRTIKSSGLWYRDFLNTRKTMPRN
jgi:beta-glucosidase